VALGGQDEIADGRSGGFYRWHRGDASTGILTRFPKRAPNFLIAGDTSKTVNARTLHGYFAAERPA